MTADPPLAHTVQPRTVVADVIQRLHTTVQTNGVQRVYVGSDGRHHWSRDLQQTLCGLPTSKADVKKPGDVECSTCQQLAEVHP